MSEPNRFSVYPQEPNRIEYRDARPWVNRFTFTWDTTKPGEEMKINGYFPPSGLEIVDDTLFATKAAAERAGNAYALQFNAHCEARGGSHRCAYLGAEQNP